MTPTLSRAPIVRSLGRHNSTRVDDGKGKVLNSTRDKNAIRMKHVYRTSNEGEEELLVGGSRGKKGSRYEVR